MSSFALLILLLLLLTCLPMTSDRRLDGGSGRWDLSFLDSDLPPPHPHPLASQPTFWSVGQKTRDGFWTPEPNSQTSDVISSSVGRRHVIIPRPTETGNARGLRTTEGDSIGLRTTALPSQHFYQNVLLQGDDYVSGGASPEVVDRLTKVTIEDDDVSFFLPVVNSPSAVVHPTPPPPPWLTVTPSGSDADTGSRSQSIGSQDSLDLDCCVGLRLSRDDSGIGLTGGGGGGGGGGSESSSSSAAFRPRRNSSAPLLNDLLPLSSSSSGSSGSGSGSSGGVAVCRPSPSPLGGRRRTTAATHMGSVEGRRRRRRDDLSPTKTTDRLTTTDDDDDDCCCPGAYSKIARFLPSWDVERLSTVFRRLGICRFYLGRLSFDEAKFLLRGFPVGTFLLRDSSDDRFLFSLSVQTTRGTTSIRVLYEAGNFRLDCEPEQVHLMPTFDCVVRLIRHYVRLAATDFGGGGGGRRRGVRNSFVFLETTGRRDTPVLLRRPWANRPSALRHLCRLRINALLPANSSSSSSSSAVDRLYLIPSLKGFLKDYPYDI